MKKNNFILNAVFLTLTSLINMGIGMAFRIYMSNKIGAECIGLYQLITSIYLFATTFSTSGISLTVTRLVTDYTANNQFSKAKKIVNKCLIFGIIISVITSVLLFSFSYQISFFILNDIRAVISLKILSLSLPFVAISSCFRGYFYAVRRVIKTASEQLLEQLIEIIVFIILIQSFSPLTIEFSCAAIVIGTTVAEFISCIYSYLLFLYDIKGLGPMSTKVSDSFFSILSLFLPLTASASLRSGLSTIENILIPDGLKKYGSSNQKALSVYGTIVGMVLPIIYFPTLILVSFSMLLIPEMSEANAVHHKRNITYMATRVLKLTLIFSIAVMSLLMFFSFDIGNLIYSNKECGTYLKILSPLVPLMYLDKIVDGMLKGLNEQLHYLSYNIIDSITRVILIFMLIPKIGISGLIIMTFVSTILNSTLSIARLLKVANVKIKPWDWILSPLICSSLAIVTLKIVLELINFNSLLVQTLVEMLLFTFIYSLMLIVVGCITKEDIYWFKGIIKLKNKKTNTI